MAANIVRKSSMTTKFLEKGVKEKQEACLREMTKLKNKV